jgi:ribosomal protein S18 acetylase RimI-like enzyme
MIRQATENDLDQIAIVHRACFPDSLSTKLGRLQSFYKEYMTTSPELFLVAVDDQEKIVGFCMGYYMENGGFMKNYLKKNLLQLSLKMIRLLTTGNKAAWKKMVSKFSKQGQFEITDKQFSTFSQEKIGDLLSICVLPECHGNGMANEMIDKYVRVLEIHDRKLCLLTVAVDNDRGVHFYEKHGFVPYKEIPNQCRTYAKRLV